METQVPSITQTLLKPKTVTLTPTGIIIINPQRQPTDIYVPKQQPLLLTEVSKQLSPTPTQGRITLCSYSNVTTKPKWVQKKTTLPIKKQQTN